MFLNICFWQNDEYSFTIKDNIPLHVYDDAGVDRMSFTDVVLTFRRVNDDGNELTLDITDKLEYLYDCKGLTINFDDFGQDKFNGYDYCYDYLYEGNVSYQYDGKEYNTSYTRGFHALISRVVYQQTLRSDWKKTLACTCGCEQQNSTLRKWHYLQMMRTTAELCLINEWLRMLEALYKITGQVHEMGLNILTIPENE